MDKQWREVDQVIIDANPEEIRRGKEIEELFDEVVKKIEDSSSGYELLSARHGAGRVQDAINNKVSEVKLGKPKKSEQKIMDGKQ